MVKFYRAKRQYWNSCVRKRENNHHGWKGYMVFRVHRLFPPVSSPHLGLVRNLLSAKWTRKYLKGQEYFSNSKGFRKRLNTYLLIFLYEIFSGSPWVGWVYRPLCLFVCLCVCLAHTLIVEMFWYFVWISHSWKCKYLKE